MAKSLPDSLLQAISDAVSALDNGCSEDAFRLLADLEATMTTIIEIIKVEDTLSQIDASPMDLIDC